MNERPPRPSLRFVPPRSEHGPGADRLDFLPASPEPLFDHLAEHQRFPLPDYSQVSDKELSRAEMREAFRLISADLGHFFLRALVLSSQLYAILYHGEDIPF